MGNKSRISNVRIVDSAAGVDGLRTDRQISAVKTSESQMRIVVGDSRDLGTSTSDTLGTYSFDDIFGTDDFVSMAQQFNLFRIVSIKFEIFDINSTVAVFNTWGVWHDNYEGTIPTYTRANIADLPDSRVLSNGTGQTVLYWNAHGTAEQQFQAASTAGSVAQRYGGLRYFFSPVASANIAKYTIQMHAVVDFRGRR
jgi:hypothetical protein